MDLENQYYNSKALKEDDPCLALDSFQKVGKLNTLTTLYYLQFISTVSVYNQIIYVHGTLVARVLQIPTLLPGIFKQTEAGVTAQCNPTPLQYGSIDGPLD